MKLITKTQLTKLMQNWEKEDLGELKPVVKLVIPSTNTIWLMVAATRDRDGITLYGLCDLGLGEVEWSDISLNELKLAIRDSNVTLDKNMNEYDNIAHKQPFNRLIT